MLKTLLISEAAKQSISVVVKELLVPKLKQCAEELSLDIKEMLTTRGEHFQEYLRRTYNRNEIMNTIVHGNTQLKLKDIYVPLTLFEEINNPNRVTKQINGYPKDIMDKYQKILITDTAGMGKSTLTKRIYLDIIDNGQGIPIYVELRRLSRTKKILEEIQDQLNSISQSFDAKLLTRLISSGGFIFILDGYDEISLSEKEIVTNDIQDFIAQVSADNKIIMSSRPESSLNSFGDFKSFKIKPLERKEAYNLMRKYDSNGETSNLLIEQLETGRYSMIDEFLKNPLLVSLLFTAFDFKQTIPIKKHVFYRQVYDAYFDSHDLSKGGGFVHEKKSKLSTDDFNKILRAIGYECLLMYKLEFDKDTILQLITKAKTRCPNLQFDESDLLDDLLKAVPLFVQDGLYYKWTHKSLQEYFAAQFIYLDAKNLQQKILENLYKSKRQESYHNLLDLYYDIDEEGFNQYVLLQYIKDYKEYYTKNFDPQLPVNKELQEKRLYLLYLNRYYIGVPAKQMKLGHDFFDEATNLFKSETGENEFSSVTHFHLRNNKRGLLVIGVDRNEAQLSIVLARHLPSIFMPFRHTRDYEKLCENIENGKLMIIDTGTGSSQEDIYDAINSAIIEHIHNLSIPEYSKLLEKEKQINEYINLKNSSEFIGIL
jgi:hypothetical protein